MAGSNTLKIDRLLQNLLEEILVLGRFQKTLAEFTPDSSIAGAYFARVSYPLQVWQACGSPVQFTPRLPWWQPFVYAWLVGSGWLPRRSSRRSFPEPY